jgi:hypothetical protein
MKRAVFLVATGLMSASCGRLTHWQELNAKDCGIVFSTPTAAKETSRPMVAGSSLMQHTWVSVWGYMEFTANCGELPPELFDRMSEAEVHEARRKVMVKQIEAGEGLPSKGQFIGEAKVTSRAHAGWEMRFRLGERQTFLLREFYDRSHVYAFSVVTWKSLNSWAVRRYFDSVQLPEHAKT